MEEEEPKGGIGLTYGIMGFRAELMEKRVQTGVEGLSRTDSKITGTELKCVEDRVRRKVKVRGAGWVSHTDATPLTYNTEEFCQICPFKKQGHI